MHQVVYHGVSEEKVSKHKLNIRFAHYDKVTAIKKIKSNYIGTGERTTHSHSTSTRLRPPICGMCVCHPQVSSLACEARSCG